MKKITFVCLFVIATVFNTQAQFPQDFETTVPPTGWTSFRGTNGLGTAQDWQASTTFAVSGVQSAFVRYEAAAATVEDWLVTPQFTPSAATNILSFQQRQQFTTVYNSVYTIRVSTASQTTHADFTIVDTQTEATVPLGAWGVRYVDLSAYNGIPIYVAFVMANDDGDNWYVDDVDLISSSTAPGCSANPSPANLATNVDIPGTNLTFAWDVPTTGDAPTNYNFQIGTVSGTYILSLTTVAPTIDLTGLAYNTTYYWKVTPLNAGGSATGCLEWSFTTGNPPPPPANNNCSGAITLTPGTAFNVNPIVGTNVSATGSGELPLPGCATYDPVDPSGYGGDVWYAVTVPADGNLTIETNGNPTGADGDSGMAVYTGACGALVLLECDDDDSADGFYSLVSIDPTDNLANQTVYVRVWEYAGDEPLTFQVSAHSATLSIADADVNTFTYFPNPVKNTLNLKAQSAIQNVSVYNMLGQEVLRTAPNSLNSEVNMGSLQTGAYFVKVTINDATETIRVIKQ